MIISRDDNVDATTDSSPSGGSSNTTPIIIGVVVGGVAAIAITAALLVFLKKKWKWDQIRQDEEQLIAHNVRSRYKMNGLKPSEYAMTPGRPSSSFSAYQYTNDRHEPREINEQPPQYHQALPLYNPSKYRTVHLPPAVNIPATTTTVQPPLQQVHYAHSRGLPQLPGAMNQPMQPYYPDNSSLPPPQQSWSRGPSLDWPRSSIQSDRNFQVTRASEESSSTLPDQGPRAPRKPKPVLSKLITDLN